MSQAQQTGWVAHPWVVAGQRKVRAGVHLMDPCDDWTQYLACAKAAEELGFDAIWVADHPMITADCWTTLAALAVSTRSIRLGSLVSCIFYRNPALLARIAADVDRLSQGRLILGLGIGDLPFEFAQMGLPFPGARERQEALEEVIQVVKGLWGTTPFTYEGKHAQVRQANPPFGPVQQPHIPLLIAGGGEQVTLCQVALHADASNFGAHVYTGGAARSEDIVRKCNVLRAHCEQLGRSPDSILRTHVTLPLVLGETPAAIAARQEGVPPALREMFRSGTLEVTPPEAIEHYHALVQAGMQYFIIGVWPNDVETLQLFSQQVAPALMP
jgi:alkanesulfonate monooxygenase SsuD/methylene tetrahydromethanopterin reductase-like flavin-dependent oxidoreductase (luciferase family)